MIEEWSVMEAHRDEWHQVSGYPVLEITEHRSEMSGKKGKIVGAAVRLLHQRPNEMPQPAG